MSNDTLWYIARSSGLIAWALMTASVVLGIMLSARLVKTPSKAWQTDLHRFLGGLSVVFVVVHVVGIVLDRQSHFSWLAGLVPFVASWRPWATVAGVVALYLLLAVEVTSLLKKHMPLSVWKGVHYTSYPLFAFTTLHSVASGTDTRSTLMALGVAVTVIVIGVLTVARLYAADAQLDAREARKERLAELAGRR
ncbi:MAG TPA: ferric reductase-like transmembrane domain-containing protein [Acidimicrobiia bacterium]